MSKEVVVQRPRVPLTFAHSFYGFPQKYYNAKFPNVGSKEIASEVMEAVKAANIDIKPVQRGLDHGVWASFKVGTLLERSRDNR